MQLLLAVLRDQAEVGTPRAEDMDDMLRLAEEEHVLAWARACVRRQYPSLPPQIQHRLAEIDRSSAIAAFYWSSELRSVLGEFAKRSIPVLPLKGPLLAERLYGSTALRACRDLDLLVSENDLARAEEILTECGYTPHEQDDYHRAWQRRDTGIELHRDVENPLAYNFATAAALQRAQPAMFQGFTCMQLLPEDELLYLCLHAARHRYDRLSLLVDLRLAFEKLPQSSQRWNPRGEVHSLDGLLALGQLMVQRLDPAFIHIPAVRISSTYRAHLNVVADELWAERMSHPGRHLNWRTVHAFFMRIEEPGLPRAQRWMRHMRILAARLIDADTTFAGRFGLHRRWQARLVRPARLIAKAMGDRSSKL
jgi:hypothetical protein